MTVRGWLIRRVRARHVDWYLNPGDEAAGYPIMCASRNGVSVSDYAAYGGVIPAATRALADAIAAGLAHNPRTNLHLLIRRLELVGGVA